MEENAPSRLMTSLALVQWTTLARCVKPECGVSVTPVSVVVSVWTSLMDMNVRLTGICNTRHAPVVINSKQHFRRWWFL